MRPRTIPLVPALLLLCFLASYVDILAAPERGRRQGREQAREEDDDDRERRGRMDRQRDRGNRIDRDRGNRIDRDRDRRSRLDSSESVTSLPPVDYSDLQDGDLVRVPMPDGRQVEFQLSSAPLLSRRMLREHPEILSFRGVAVNSPALTARFVVLDDRLHGIVLSPDGAAVFDSSPQESANSRWMGSEAAGVLACGTENLEIPPVGNLEFAAGSDVRSYRLAISSAAEFTQQSGSAANALADIVSFVNDLNGLYERDVAITFILQDTLIFEDAATDPFPAVTNDPATIAFQDLLTANQIAVDDALGASYDLSLVLTSSNPPATVGRATAGSVCNELTKANGAVASQGPGVGDTVGAMAHEIGHMFSATHTYNSTLGACLERNAATAYEPGSGSTLMGGGSCGVETVSGPNHYFHNNSIEQILGFRDGAGICGTLSVTGNAVPMVSAGADATVPLATPFTLTASATDTDNDALTYTWEQFDLGLASPPLNVADGPLFRSLGPGADSARTFPSLDNLLAGTADSFESLPTLDRVLTFRTTVRDQKGGVVDDEVVVTATGEPFQVVSPNGGEILNAGCEMSVVWNVGGGIISPTVNILISVDGGMTFDMAAAATANDGEEAVPVPCMSSGSGDAWVLIEATDGIFFDLSDAGFTIDLLAPEIFPTISATPVDEMCLSTISYTADITDDCGVDALDTLVTPMVVGANATLGVPFLDLVQVSPVQVSASGNVVVSDLISSPVVVRVQFVTTDSCGVDTSVLAEVMISDLIPPTISCPEDVLVECSAFGGAPADDPQLTDFFAGISAEDNCDPNPAIVNDAADFFPLGTTPVEFTATDASGNSTSCTALVTVQDTTPPDVDASVSPTLLWPPNHKLIDIMAQVFSTDICDPSPVTVLESIEANESNNGVGDGNTANDIVGAELQTLDLSFQLRAERRGPGNGRTYSINYTATDQSDNVGSDTPVVKVPHDQGRRRGPAQSDKDPWRGNN